jgi:flavin reductase (DIM6/NTAB) family NADH-FMN oxidoreductase RutF
MLFDFDQIPHREAYKLCVASIVPRPVAWVVSQDREGRVNAAPYSFFNVFSDNPVIVAIGCSKRPTGSPKDTLANIEATGQFVVNLVSYSNMEAMNVTAIDFPAGVDEMRQAGLTAVPSSRVKVPRIAESPVALECEIFQFIPTRSHTIVLGRVLGVDVRDDCVLDAAKYYLDTPKLDLMGRMHGAGWYARTTDRIEQPRIPLADWQARSKG